MKTPFLVHLCFLVCPLFAVAEDSFYQDSLQRLHDRRVRLESSKRDPREKRLSADEESERLRLIAQLREEDPLWVLMEEISMELHELVAAELKRPEDESLANQLKDFLALTAGLQSTAKDLGDANKLASAIRLLIVRRDIAGMGELVRKARN